MKNLLDPTPHKIHPRHKSYHIIGINWKHI